MLPDLTMGKLVATSERLIEQEMRTAYFDTSDFRLWRRGISLRHRTGEEPGVETWTAKLPSLSEGPTLDRMELSWSGPRESVPDRGCPPLSRNNSQLTAPSNRRVGHDEAAPSPE